MVSEEVCTCLFPLDFLNKLHGFPIVPGRINPIWLAGRYLFSLPGLLQYSYYSYGERLGEIASLCCREIVSTCLPAYLIDTF